MATPIGVNTLTAISRRLIDEGITDVIYGSVPLSMRALRSGRKVYKGGTQLEVPLITSRRNTGTWYGGTEVLPTQLADTVQNLAFGWKYYGDNLTFSRPQLIQAASPIAIADLVATQLEQAKIETVDNLETALWTLNPANPLQPDTVPNACDNGINTPVYGGWNRTTLPVIKGSSVNDLGAALSEANMNKAFQTAKLGGQEPTIAFTDSHTYQAFWNLIQPLQRFTSNDQFQDTMLAGIGFSNLYFNQVPVVVGSAIPLDISGVTHQIFWLNENYWKLYVQQDNEFSLSPPIRAQNTSAVVMQLNLSCNMICSNPARQTVEFGIA